MGRQQHHHHKSLSEHLQKLRTVPKVQCGKSPHQTPQKEAGGAASKKIGETSPHRASARTKPSQIPRLSHHRYSGRRLLCFIRVDVWCACMYTTAICTSEAGEVRNAASLAAERSCQAAQLSNTSAVHPRKAIHRPRRVSEGPPHAFHRPLHVAVTGERLSPAFA